MKKRYLILFLICIIISTKSVLAVDYYPEMGLDPFYSSLNPEYLDEDMSHEHDTVVNFFKKKKQAIKDRKDGKISPVKEKKSFFANKKTKTDNKELPAVNKDKNKDGIVETADDTFVTQPKPKMTNKELEKALLEEEREKQKELQQAQAVPLKERFNIFKKKDTTPKEPVEKVDPNIELTADYMEYFPERYEVEAVGNAKVLFKVQKTTLTANKIVFNYDRNILKANENVVLISPTTVTDGDFLKLDLSKPNGWVENPVSKTEDIELRAKEAFLYSNKIEEYDGVAKILKDDVISFGARSFASYVDQNRVFSTDQPRLTDEEKGVYKLKANKIIIDSKDDHEVITVRNADLYLKNHKIASIPSFKIVTNKQHASAETNLPELGSQAMLGMHVGPAVVLNVPGGSTLKLAPILTYKDKFGVGGIARFRNQYNMTELAYGSSKDQVLLRGRHKIAPGWSLDYSRYTNQSEWFMGYRMPKYAGQLSYSRSDNVTDLGLQFSQRYTAGVFVDRLLNKHTKMSDAEGRFRWMTQTYKPIYEYMNEEETVGLRAGLVAQTAATVYTTGDTVGLFRIGPALSTKVGPWNQALMFYETASAGQSPFHFDRYRYGRSNFVLIENLKVCKYLSVGYLASLSINSDYNDKLFQESRLLIGVGPEYAKVIFGYDARRRNAIVILTMLVGTKNSEVEFKKSEVNNPDKIGKEKSKQKKVKKKSYKKFLKDKDAMVPIEAGKSK